MSTQKPIVLKDGNLEVLQPGDSLGVGQASIDPSLLTAPRSIQLPDKSGTVALLSDVTSSSTDGILTHEYDSAGGKNMTYNMASGVFIELGPLVVVDNNGNVVTMGG